MWSSELSVDDDVDLKNYRAFSQYKSNLARAKERKRGGLFGGPGCRNSEVKIEYLILLLFLLDYFCPVLDISLSYNTVFLPMTILPDDPPAL